MSDAALGITYLNHADDFVPLCCRLPPDTSEPSTSPMRGIVWTLPALWKGVVVNLAPCVPPTLSLDVCARADCLQLAFFLAILYHDVF